MRPTLFFVLFLTFSGIVHATPCSKTFEARSGAAISGEPCADRALNEADRDLNASYRKYIAIEHAFPDMYLWIAQKRWVDDRNRCVASGNADCVAMTKARTAFFEMQAGNDSGDHRMLWYGRQSRPMGAMGHFTEFAFFQFVKPSTPGEVLFNSVVQQEYQKRAREHFRSTSQGPNDTLLPPDRNCYERVIMGTATLRGGVIRIPISSTTGCTNPSAPDATISFAVDLDRAVIVKP